MGESGQHNATLQLLYPRETPSTHCIGGWVDPGASLGRCGKYHPPLGFDPCTIQPVVRCYTKWAIQGHNINTTDESITDVTGKPRSSNVLNSPLPTTSMTPWADPTNTGMRLTQVAAFGPWRAAAGDTYKLSKQQEMTVFVLTKG